MRAPEHCDPRKVTLLQTCPQRKSDGCPPGCHLPRTGWQVSTLNFQGCHQSIISNDAGQTKMTGQYSGLELRESLLPGNSGVSCPSVEALDR